VSALNWAKGRGSLHRPIAHLWPLALGPRPSALGPRPFRQQARRCPKIQLIRKQLAPAEDPASMLSGSPWYRPCCSISHEKRSAQDAILSEIYQRA